MGDLGHRDGTGVIGTDASSPFGVGKWNVIFDPQDLAVSTGDFEVYHIALKGPTGSQFQVYIDRTFYDANNHGDLNSWDPNQPMGVKGGQTIYFYFNSSATPAPAITIYLREPNILNAN